MLKHFRSIACLWSLHGSLSQQRNSFKVYSFQLCPSFWFLLGSFTFPLFMWSLSLRNVWLVYSSPVSITHTLLLLRICLPQPWPWLWINRAVGSPCLPLLRSSVLLKHLGLNITYHSNSSVPLWPQQRYFKILCSSSHWKKLCPGWSVVDCNKIAPGQNATGS